MKQIWVDLHRYAHKLTHNWSLAEDLTQDTLVRQHFHADTALLRHTCKALYYDWCRLQGIHREKEQRVAVKAAVVSESATAADDRAQQVEHAANRLPRKQREAIRRSLAGLPLNNAGRFHKCMAIKRLRTLLSVAA